MSIYQIYGSSTGDAEAAANLDVQFDGQIIAWDLWATINGAGGDGNYHHVEVSFLSSDMSNKNDARGVICSVRDTVSVLDATGAQFAATRSQLSGLFIPVVAGERLYMHLGATAGNVITASCRLYVDDASNPQLRRRR